MKRTRLIIPVLLGLCISLGLGWSQQSSAQRGGVVAWRSSSDNLTLTLIDNWGRSCTRGTPSTAYRVRGGVRGLLYPADCNDNSRDNIALMRFEDTEGAERCVGAMKFESLPNSSPLAANTVWTIEGAVRGSICSTVGQTFEVRVFNVQ